MRAVLVGERQAPELNAKVLTAHTRRAALAVLSLSALVDVLDVLDVLVRLGAA